MVEERISRLDYKLGLSIWGKERKKNQEKLKQNLAQWKTRRKEENEWGRKNNWRNNCQNFPKFDFKILGTCSRSLVN